MSAPQAAWLGSGDARRLHLQHGPIDLVIGASGAPEAVEQAYARAWARFQDVLARLVEELHALRQPLGEAYPLFRHPVARRMAAACWPYREGFITPMAAVAGAVADEILTAMRDGLSLEKAYVNNGGDIALHLAPGAVFSAGIVCRNDQPALDAVAEIPAALPVRGIATSGWRGRSQSLGVADAVTILAADAAAADAAATIVANAVNVEHPAVQRRPAREVRDDSDLGDRLVTVTVGALPNSAVQQALSAGAAVAHDLRRRGLLHAAFLSLAGEHAVVGEQAGRLVAKEAS